MRIRVQVTTGSRNASVDSISPGEFRVRVRERPVDGQANEAVIRAIAEHFDVPPSAVRITAGHGSRKKTIEITNL